MYPSCRQVRQSIPKRRDPDIVSSIAPPFSKSRTRRGKRAAGTASTLAGIARPRNRDTDLKLSAARKRVSQQRICQVHNTLSASEQGGSTDTLLSGKAAPERAPSHLPRARHAQENTAEEWPTGPTFGGGTKAKEYGSSP